MRMHVSWHATTDSSTLRDRVLSTLPASWRTLEQATPHTQFEHLGCLVNDAINRGGPPQWVCFTDDDDLWSPRRSKLLTAEARDTGPSTYTRLSCSLPRSASRHAMTAASGLLSRSRMGTIHLRPRGVCCARKSMPERQRVSSTAP